MLEVAWFRLKSAKNKWKHPSSVFWINSGMLGHINHFWTIFTWSEPVCAMDNSESVCGVPKIERYRLDVFFTKWFNGQGPASVINISICASCRYGSICLYTIIPVYKALLSIAFVLILGKSSIKTSRAASRNTMGDIFSCVEGKKY